MNRKRLKQLVLERLSDADVRTDQCDTIVRVFCRGHACAFTEEPDSWIRMMIMLRSPDPAKNDFRRGPELVDWRVMKRKRLLRSRIGCVALRRQNSTRNPIEATGMWRQALCRPCGAYAFLETTQFPGLTPWAIGFRPFGADAT